MRDTVGIIIDVRRNTGGSSEMALDIVSRFIDTRTHVYSLQEKFGNTRTPLKKVYVKPQGNTQYIKPVVVLTSNTSFSAAETFTLAMKSRSNVTIIGEETNGGFSAPVSSRVTGEIAFEISNQIVLSADGKWYEHQGIPVDMKVAFASKQDRQAKKDSGIDSAIKELLK